MAEHGSDHNSPHSDENSDLRSSNHNSQDSLFKDPHHGNARDAESSSEYPKQYKPGTLSLTEPPTSNGGGKVDDSQIDPACLATSCNTNDHPGEDDPQAADDHSRYVKAPFGTAELRMQPPDKSPYHLYSC